MIKISKYYLVRNLTNDTNEIWGYQQVQTLADVLGVTLEQLGRKFGKFISIDGEFNNLNGDAVEVTTDPTSMYVKLLQTGSQFGIWNRKVNTNLDDYTVVLLHFDESTTEDECGNLWTKYGNPTLTTENAKFGQALHMTPGNAIRTDGAIITVGEADFTVDLWMYMTNSGINYQRIFQFAPVFYAQDHYFYNGIRFGVGESPGTPFSIGLGTAFTVLDSGEYYNSLIHWAVVYQHDLQKMKVYKNGAKIGELNDVNVARVARQFSFEDITVSDAKVSGYVDELRISDGIARWTEDFTPPIAPYGS